MQRGIKGVEPDELQLAFNSDKEFRLTARFWNGSLEFGIGEYGLELKLVDGCVGEVACHKFVERSRWADGNPVVQVNAPEEDWAQLLRAVPEPFYLDYYSASVHHHFHLGGDRETLWAYYPAIRRSAEVMRDLVCKEVG